MAGGTDDAEESDDVAVSGGIEAAIARRILPGAIRRRYAAKFFLSLLVVLLVIGGLGAFTLFEIQDIIQSDAEETLESTATIQASSVSNWVASMRVQTRGIAHADAFASGDTERIRAHLQESQNLAGQDVIAVHYVDPAEGTIVASTDQSVEGQAPSTISPALDEPIAQAASDPETVSKSDTAYQREGNLSMAFASGVLGANGVVVLDGDVASDFEQLHQTRSVVTTRVLSPDGRDVLDPRRNNPTAVSSTTAFDRALAGETVTVEQQAQVAALAPVPNSAWVVSTTAPKSELYRASDTVERNVIVLVGASLLALGTVGVVLGRQTVTPLVRLRQRARQMEEGDLDVDLRTQREDEIGRLFDSFHSMRVALREQIEAAERAKQQAEASQRDLVRQNERLDQFASAVSHDLRNPLTVARGNLELLAVTIEGGDTGPDDDTEDDSDDAGSPPQLIDRIDRAHERMDTIIGDVLALARGGEAVRETTRSELAIVASDAWDTVETRDATLTVADSRTVEADRDRLLRAFENLFRNAIDHAGPSVAVEVGLTESGFYVADDGPGIPANETTAVFEYGHTSTESGTGLGLSIVDTIAQAHGWNVTADTSYDTGAKFVFSNVSDD